MENGRNFEAKNPLIAFVGWIFLLLSSSHIPTGTDPYFLKMIQRFQTSFITIYSGDFIFPHCAYKFFRLYFKGCQSKIVMKNNCDVSMGRKEKEYTCVIHIILLRMFILFGLQ
jgi:hypothetical protein